MALSGGAFMSLLDYFTQKNKINELNKRIETLESFLSNEENKDKCPNCGIPMIETTTMGLIGRRLTCCRCKQDFMRKYETR